MTKGANFVLAGAFVASVGVALIAQAYPPQEQFMIYGLGTNSYGRFVSDRAAKNRSALLTTAWIAGFMTGAGTVPGMSGGRLSNTDADAITRAIETYCKAHPPDTVAEASAELADELRR